MCQLRRRAGRVQAELGVAPQEACFLDDIGANLEQLDTLTLDLDRPLVQSPPCTFPGWSDDCPAGSKPSCYSHFHGFTPTGQPTENWFPAYPERTPLLGLYTTDEATVAREVAAADTALDFFDMLYYDGGKDCGPNPQDPGLSWCLDSSLAFMLNSTTIWRNTSRLHVRQR